MKRAISLSFLLIANVILLAHTVVPHHHHENVSICFSQTTHHEHEGNPSSEKCCVIDNDYTPAENKLKTACHIHIKCNCGQILFALVSNSLNIQDFADDTIIHFRQNPYIPLFYSKFISQSIGLRAPPAY